MPGHTHTPWRVCATKHTEACVARRLPGLQKAARLAARTEASRMPSTSTTSAPSTCAANSALPHCMRHFHLSAFKRGEGEGEGVCVVVVWWWWWGEARCGAGAGCCHRVFKGVPDAGGSGHRCATRPGARAHSRTTPRRTSHARRTHVARTSHAHPGAPATAAHLGRDGVDRVPAGHGGVPLCPCRVAGKSHAAHFDLEFRGKAHGNRGHVAAAYNVQLGRA